MRLDAFAPHSPALGFMLRESCCSSEAIFGRESASHDWINFATILIKHLDTPRCTLVWFGIFNANLEMAGGYCGCGLKIVPISLTGQ